MLSCQSALYYKRKQGLSRNQKCVASHSKSPNKIICDGVEIYFTGNFLAPMGYVLTQRRHETALSDM